MVDRNLPEQGSDAQGFTPKVRKKREPAVERTCEACSKTFMAPAFVVAGGGARFCCIKCSAPSRAKKQWETRARRPEPSPKQCEGCGAIFTPTRAQAATSGGLFCTKACASKTRWAAKQQPVETRFWSKVDRSGGPDACWLWLGSLHGKGYGHFRIGKQIEKAHRVALSLHTGLDLRGDWQGCHTCDTPRCCNPAHIVPADNDWNLSDRQAKRRHAHGMRHSRATLTDDLVLAIRSASGTYPQIAARFGTTKSIVGAIKTGRTWRHLKE